MSVRGNDDKSLLLNKPPLFKLSSEIQLKKELTSIFFIYPTVMPFLKTISDLLHFYNGKPQYYTLYIPKKLVVNIQDNSYHIGFNSVVDISVFEI